MSQREPCLYQATLVKFTTDDEPKFPCKGVHFHSLRAILNRAKKGWIQVKSVHFCHFRQLPYSTMSKICRATASMVNKKSHSFLTSNLILHSWLWKKYVKQYLECIRGCQSCPKNYLTSNFLLCKTRLILQSKIWLVKSQKTCDNNINF